MVYGRPLNTHECPQQVSTQSRFHENHDDVQESGWWQTRFNATGALPDAEKKSTLCSTAIMVASSLLNSTCPNSTKGYRLTFKF